MGKETTKSAQNLLVGVYNNFATKLTPKTLIKIKFVCIYFPSWICKFCMDNNPHQILFQVEIECSGGPLLLINKHLYIEILGVCLFVCFELCLFGSNHTLTLPNSRSTLSLVIAEHRFWYAQKPSMQQCAHVLFHNFQQQSKRYWI